MSSDRILSASLGSVLTGDNAAYLEQLRAAFRSDPHSVDPSWHLALGLLGDGPVAGPDMRNLLRARGHTVAALNPLDGERRDMTASARAATLHPQAGERDYRHLAETYCGPLGVETEHIDDTALRRWIYRAFEEYAPDGGWLAEHARLTIRTAEFERLMHTKFPTKKRFGCEGAEAIVALVRRSLDRLAARGVERVVIGTMHRGRLALLVNALERPLEVTLAEFCGRHPFGNGTAADVPYHLGWRTTLGLGGSGSLEVELLPNPSHLEAVNPVALGKARGLQDADGKRTAALILHTDSAVIGQGSVAEIVQLAGLAGYTTGGAIHIVIDNQIGFTTNPAEARASRYCTGAWKASDSLILHVNGEDADGVIKAADIGVDFRCEHGHDAVIDFVCYRRNGHNEVDEPRFTQPLLYREIGNHPAYADALVRQAIARGIVDAATVDGWKADLVAEFAAAYDRAKQSGTGQEASRAEAIEVEEPAAGVPPGQLENLLLDLSGPPQDFPVDQRLRRILQARRDCAASGVNWPTAEALAFASLNAEGVPVRLSGQDVVRGAFSQRHYDIANQQSGDFLRQIGRGGEDRTLFDAVNSPLSEYAVLGFEYGYSLARPECLTIWEAQFGDFANGAQIVIDQFVTSAKEKWNIDSGLTILLPHGLDGQGPEHSSARIERFLQLSEPANIDVAVPSTPASYFHILRAQALRRHRRPLALIGAKALLRHPSAISPLAAFGPDFAFRPVLVSAPADPREVRGVIFCSGKIAYDLERLARETGANVAIIRLERIAPFPRRELIEAIGAFPASAFCYVQEEPANMGALTFIRPRLEEMLTAAGRQPAKLGVVSRPASGSPAGSFHELHAREQAELTARAIDSVAMASGKHNRI